MITEMKTEDGTTIRVHHKQRFFHEYFDCMCESDEHVVRFSYFVDEYQSDKMEDEMYFSFQMPAQPFLNRLANAFWYVLGRESKWGHWGTTIFKMHDAERLKTLLDRYISSGLNHIETDKENDERKLRSKKDTET